MRPKKGASRSIRKAKRAGRRKAGTPFCPHLLATGAGFNILGDSTLNLSRSHCSRWPKGIYAQQTLTLGPPGQAKRIQFVISREVPFTKLRKGDRVLEAEDEAKWPEASLLQFDTKHSALHIAIQ